jgi:hypothetical protein
MMNKKTTRVTKKKPVNNDKKSIMIQGKDYMSIATYEDFNDANSNRLSSLSGALNHKNMQDTDPKKKRGTAMAHTNEQWTVASTEEYTNHC